MKKARQKHADVSAIGFRPLGDKLVIDPCKAPTMTDTGLALPDGAGEQIPKGTVLAIGPGSRDKATGELVPATVKIGQVVWYPKYSGVQIDLDDKAYLVISEKALLGVEE